MVVKVARESVVAFRLRAHHLAERLGPESLLDAAGACGVQNSPPGSALLALNARVRGVSQHVVDEAVTAQKTLLQSWAMRGAPFYFPTRDAHVFTAGVLPPTEAAMRHFLLGAGPAVARPASAWARPSPWSGTRSATYCVAAGSRSTHWARSWLVRLPRL